MATISPRRVLLPVSLATSLSLLGDTSLYTVLPTHTLDAGIALASVGILLSANRFVRLALNGPIGYLSDRWPRRRIFIPALFVGAFSTAIYALTIGFWPLFLGRLLWGISWAGLWVSGNAIVLDVTHDTDRGRWVGFYQVAFFMGASMGALSGGVLTDLLSYHMAMGVAATLTFVGAVVAFIFVPETSQLRVRHPAKPYNDDNSKNASRRTELISVNVLYGANRLIMAGVLMATFGLFLSQQLGDTVKIAGQTFGVTSVTGIALSASTLIGMLVAPFAGVLSDRLRTRWGVISGGLVSGITGFALIAQGTFQSILFGLPLASAASGSTQSLSTSLIGDLSQRTKYGRRLGVLFTIGDLGSAAGPIIAYALLPLIGLTSVYRLCAFLFGLVLLLALRWAIQPRKGMATVG